MMNKIKKIGSYSVLGLFLMSCGVPKNEHNELLHQLEQVKQDLKECEYTKSKMSNAHSEHSMTALPLEKRIAFMSGHVEAGLALYRAGKPDQAAAHLLHPVSETHQAERAGIDSLGFKPELFQAVSSALNKGLPASETAPMLLEAENNITLLQQNSGGEFSEIIMFLMTKVNEEYQEGVKDGLMMEPGEYQDAFGFSVVALKMAKRKEKDSSALLVKELEKLLGLWPLSGPIAESKPTPVKEVMEQTKRVISNL